MTNMVQFGSLKSDQDAEDDKCGRFATWCWNDLHQVCWLTIRIVRVASGRGHGILSAGSHQRNERCGAFFIARTVRRGEIPFLRMEQWSASNLA